MVMRKTMLTARHFALALAVVTVFAQLSVFAQNGKEATIIGSWDVQITIRDCGTGAILFGFPAMLTYNQGGTMMESDLGAPVLTRLTGHGVWERQSGREFSAAFRWLNFAPDRSFAGTNVARSAIHLAPDGKTYTSEDAGSLILPSGAEIPIGCATTVATRFQ